MEFKFKKLITNPKWVNRILGVSESEANVPANISKGITTPGIYLKPTLASKIKIVHRAKDVPVDTPLASDDAVVSDPVITITTHPTNRSVVSGNSAQFSVVASSTGGGSGITYQWQVSTNSGTTWTNVSTGGRSANYTITTNSGLNNNRYRVIVSQLDAVSVTSSVATLTVT